MYKKISLLGILVFVFVSSYAQEGLPAGKLLNIDKWSVGYGWGLNTGAFYDDVRPENVIVEDGILKIKVEDLPAGVTNAWPSGAINSKNKFGQKGGYFEAKIKVAKGSGLLNAFWAKTESDIWPPEIDMVEILGKSPEIAWYTLHYDQGGHKSSGGTYNAGIDLSEDFHVYGFEWTEKDFVWYLDGIERRRTTDAFTNINSYIQDWYIMLNVHVVCADCSEWTGWPNTNNVWPSYMEVDWVRAYQIDKGVNVSIEQPLNNSFFKLEETIPIKLNLVSESSVISKIEIFLDDRLIQTADNITHNFDLKNVPAGRHKIVARVYNELGASLDSSPAYLTVDLQVDELIFNGQFDNDFDNWTLSSLGDASASLFLEKANPVSGENTAGIEILSMGESTTHISFFQPLYLHKNQNYLLSFKARADRNQTIAFAVKSNETASSKYYLLNSTSLENEVKAYSYSMLSDKEDFTATLEFYAGKGSGKIYLDSISFKENNETSKISKTFINPEISIYPNPVRNNLFIKIWQNNSQENIIRIMDIQGRVLISEKTKNSENPIIIDVNTLKSGLYLFELISAENLTFNTKIIKE